MTPINLYHSVSSVKPFAVPIGAAIDVPIYARTDTTIPIGFALTRKGVSVRAFMAPAIGGAGASVPELTRLAGIFKRRLWIAYAVTIFSIATFVGFRFNFLTAGAGLKILNPVK
ncbi:MAG: hypothetical protein ACYC7H_12400, partial [Chloroflexota bacterium]